MTNKLDASKIPEALINGFIPFNSIFSFILNDITYTYFFLHPSVKSIPAWISGLYFNPTLINFGFHYMLLDCKILFKQIALYPDEMYKLDLTDRISDGKLLYINYTAQNAGCIPTEIHGNCPMGHEYSKVKTLFPIPINNVPQQKTKVSILYVYASADQWNNPILHELINAFDSMTKLNYVSFITQLQKACELALRNFNSKHNNNFSTYFKKLHDLPKQLSEYNLPPMPNVILETLDEIRKLRNIATHEGTLDNITKDKVKKFAMYSFLFCKYFEIMDTNDSSHKAIMRMFSS